MVEKPDVYICMDCGNRFQTPEYINVEEDGLVFTRPSCPKCKSTTLKLSSLEIPSKD